MEISEELGSDHQSSTKNEERGPGEFQGWQNFWEGPHRYGPQLTCHSLMMYFGDLWSHRARTGV